MLQQNEKPVPAVFSRVVPVFTSKQQQQKQSAIQPYQKRLEGYVGQATGQVLCNGDAHDIRPASDEELHGAERLDRQN